MKTNLKLYGELLRLWLLGLQYRAIAYSLKGKALWFHLKRWVRFYF